MKLQQLIEKHWYEKFDPWLGVILFPFSLIFETLVMIRRWSFYLHLKPSRQLPVPVIVIGNISVGGAGKTPLTKHLAITLEQLGIKVGVVLRGYKSRNKQAQIVSATAASREVGDEALLYAMNGIKVAIARDRVAAAQLLLSTYPQLQLILADDGMQHYSLARDLEICVIDSSRLLGNRQLLPLGPLREPLARLNTVDYIVVNGSYNYEQLSTMLKQYHPPVIYQKLEFEEFYNPATGARAKIEWLNQQPILPMAAIGNPERFYLLLRELGLKFKQVKTFPDHHHYLSSDIPHGYTIITTEKDYTKLSKFNNNNIWVAKVKIKLDNAAFIQKIVQLATH